MLAAISSFMPSFYFPSVSAPSTKQIIRNIQKVALPLIFVVSATYAEQVSAGFAAFTICMGICTAATAGAFVPACVAACVASIAAPTP
jgi:hypothetical protein